MATIEFYRRRIRELEAVLAATEEERESCTVKDFCQTYGMGKTWVRDRIADGRLPVIRAGRRVLILEKEARTLLGFPAKASAELDVSAERARQTYESTRG